MFVNDLNTGVLSDALLRAPPSLFLLESFFRCRTPERLIDDLQKEFNLSLQNPDSGILKPLDDFFDLRVSEKRKNKETWILYNEEADCIELTKRGALSLLEHFEKIRTVRVD